MELMVSALNTVWQLGDIPKMLGATVVLFQMSYFYLWLTSFEFQNVLNPWVFGFWNVLNPWVLGFWNVLNPLVMSQSFINPQGGLF